MISNVALGHPNSPIVHPSCLPFEQCQAINNRGHRPLRGQRARWLFDRQKAIWTKMTIIDRDRPELGSWLEEAPRGQPWGIGCRVCRVAFKSDAINPWASLTIRGRSVRMWSIKRHMASTTHKRSIMKTVGAVDIQMLDAPSNEEFLKVLADSRQGKPHNGTPAIAGRHKICKMRWCLAEAVRDIEREHVRQSIAVALHQDAREQLLLVRFAAVTDQMKVMRGVLGITQDYGTVADDICKATMTMCESFCTPRMSMPSGGNHMGSAVDSALLEHLRSIVEVIDADAATDEQRAIRILQGTSKSAAIGNKVFFPKLKIVLRDRTHAATRQRHQHPCAWAELLESPFWYVDMHMTMMASLCAG